MAKLTSVQLRGLRMYLYNVVFPTAEVALFLVNKGLLQNVGWGHTLTPKGEQAALLLSREEERELMGLLTHDRVTFTFGQMNTRLYHVHKALMYLGVSTQRVEPDSGLIHFTFVCP